LVDQVLINQGGTLNTYWERDGDAYDPGIVTVTITSIDGTVVVTNAPTVGYPGAGPRSYLLTPAQASRLDYLTAVWAAADGSTLTTYVEVVGGFMFSVNFMRTRTPLQDTVTYPTQTLLDYRTLAEMALEDICGVAFVPRFSYHEATIASWGLLELPRRRIRVVRQIYTATEGGPQPLTTLAGLRIEAGSLVFMPSIWNWWSRPIQIAYEHGYDFCPPRVMRAGLELARRWIVESPWDERATGFRTRDGGEMTILTARTVKEGIAHAFDIPEVAAVAEMYGTPMIA